MALQPTWMVDQRPITEAIESVEHRLSPDVERIRFSLEDDWTGKPSIFFRVLLSDSAVRGTKLLDVTEAIRREILEAVQPYEQDLQPYFTFRTASEQRMLKDRDWE